MSSFCKTSNRLFNWYYVILFAAYFVFVFSPDMRVGVVASVVTLAVFLLGMPYRVGPKDWAVSLLFVWAAVSMIPALLGEAASFSVISSKFMSAYFPIAFYYMSKKFLLRPCRKDFFHYFMIAAVFCFAVGLWWYVTEPDYYITHLQRTVANFTEVEYHKDLRFSSFLGSIGIGMVSVIGMIVSLTRFIQTKRRNHILGVIIMAVMCILSMQRSAYILFAFFFVLILAINKRIKGKVLVIFLALLVLLVILAVFFSFVYPELFDQIFSRVLDINFESMFLSRTDQWAQLPGLGIGLITGRGVGSFTQGSNSAVNINDGAFFNIIGEIGIIGFLLFAAAVVSMISIYLKNRRKTYTHRICFLIVLAFLLNAIGSNGLLYMDMSPLFWISMGCLSLKERKRYEISGALLAPVSSDS